jgi:hypothetical protein
MTEEEIRALRTRVDNALQRQKVNEMAKTKPKPKPMPKPKGKGKGC